MNIVKTVLSELKMIIIFIIILLSDTFIFALSRQLYDFSWS